MSNLNKLTSGRMSGRYMGKLKMLVAGLCYGLSVSMPVLAEDIEIYTNSSAVDPSIQPNVLFLLDTSKSMGVAVTSRVKYKATENYADTVKYPSAITACFDPAKLYRIRGSDAATAAKKWCSPSLKDTQILGAAKISNFFCANATRIVNQNGSSAPTEKTTSKGTYRGRVGRYKATGSDNSKRWVLLNLSTADTAVVECQNDAGNHGKYASSSRKYATKRSGKTGSNIWSSNSSDKFAWSNVPKRTHYTGNYLNYLIAAPNEATYRISVIRDVMVDFVDDIEDINLGFMPFSMKTLNGKSLGGMIEVPVDDVGAPGSAQREAIKNRLKVYAVHHNDSDPGFYNGHENLILGTPSSQQYFEVLRYFKGGAPFYGANSKAPSLTASNSCSPTKIGLCADGVFPLITAKDIVSFPSVPASLAGDGSYKSPIVNECQANFTILLTDGEPYADPITAAQVTEMNPGADTSCTVDPGCATGRCSNSCLAEMVHAGALLAKNDKLAEVQPISTFTIAFKTSVPILNEATRLSKLETGKGQSFTADNADELRAHLISIVEALDVDATFSSPAVSVNAFNRSVHLNDLFFTLFKPSKGPHWDGNFKKYKLSFKKDAAGDPVYDSNGNKTPVIVDNSTPTVKEAISPTTGFFAEDSKSYWSTDIDGGDITIGGMVDVLTATRKVYTYTGSYSTVGDVSVPGDKTIIKDSNVVSKTNKSNLTASLLGIDGAATVVDGLGATVLEHDALLDWASGIDVFDEFPSLRTDSSGAIVGGPDGRIDDARMVIGDPLHSQPAIVQYGADPEDLIAFIATNDGYLHAIRTDTGEELWAFIPQEFLTSLKTNFDNVDGQPKTYGLDGNVEAWIDDSSGVKGVIDGSDRVRIYIGQRRGGSRIYALDVTNITDPKLEWVIEGGNAGTAYEELGQTWSTVNVEQVKNGATSKPVLIFGGGYDVSQDNDSGSDLERNHDHVGRTVFIADAVSGEVLWSAGRGAGGALTANMEYSIPARVKPLDISGDGNVDRLYVADMGGQVFRFDIDESTASFNPAHITGGRIADFAANGSVADARRFYYPPDVALVAERGKAAYLGIAISSGYRAHPNNTSIEDRIYLFKDRNVFDTPTTYSTLTEADLADATLNFASAGDGTTGTAGSSETELAIKALNDSEGWFIKLDDPSSPGTFIGEKGLAEPLIVEGTVIVTTYIPSGGATVGSCKPKEGSGRVFYLDILDATAAYPSDLDVRADRTIDLEKAGIPASPTIIITEDDVKAGCVGTECRSLSLQVGARRTYWNEVEK